MTYSKCRKCGHKEDGVCAVFFGHVCEGCGAIDAASILERREQRPQ